MPQDKGGTFVLIVFIICIYFYVQNEKSSPDVDVTESKPPSDWSRISDDFVERALGKWKAVYVNAEWTTEECEEIAFILPTAAEREKWKKVYPKVNFEDVKLTFTQDGDLSAFLLIKSVSDRGGRVFSAEVETVPAVDGFKKEELDAFEYVLQDDFILVNNRRPDVEGYNLVLTKDLTTLSDVQRSAGRVGVTVTSVTGCVERHDEL